MTESQVRKVLGLSRLNDSRPGTWFPAGLTTYYPRLLGAKLVFFAEYAGDVWIDLNTRAEGGGYS